MAIAQGVGANIGDNMTTIGGGVVGVGAPALLRETADVQNGQAFSLIGDPGSTLARVSRPSVVWGLGVGGLTGALWVADVGPSWLHDFYMAHAITAIPTGAVSALLPKQAGASTAAASSRSQRALRESRPGSSPSGNGEFGPAGGRSQETSPAN